MTALLRSGPDDGPRLERARGEARLKVSAADGTTRLSVLYQSGSAKLRLPRVAAGAPVEAVLLNTAGGVTGGDRLSHDIIVEAGGQLVVTTQAAERIYRRSSGVASIATTIDVGAGARLDWLPQETILFDGSVLSRDLTVKVAPDATFLAAEAMILGRRAMGETARAVSLTDRWRISRGGRLLFADSVRLDGDAEAIMAGRATGRGAVAYATVLLVAPTAESLIEPVRSAIEATGIDGGASAWNGMLVARMVAPDGKALRDALIRLIETLRGAPMPRVWNC